MPFTRLQLANNQEANQNYALPPSEWEASSATHWVFVDTTNIPDVLFEWTEARDIVPINVCAPLYSDLPYRDGAEIIQELSHKTLVVVGEERVGPEGAWHFVSVVDTNPQVDGLTGYIYNGLGTVPEGIRGTEFTAVEIRRLETTPRSNDMVFDTCIETVSTKIDEFCGLTSPRWYEAKGPYYDSDSCEYFVPVTTTHYDTGGTHLEARMAEQIPKGVKALLEYYDKPSDDATVNRILRRFKFAKATSWWIDPSNHRSPLKVLISVHAKYFDAISQQEFIVPSTAQNIFLQARTLEMQITAFSDLMEKYGSARSWREQNGTWAGPAPEYGIFDLKQEASNLRLFISNFKRLLTLNGLSLNPNSNDTYEVGIDEGFNIQYILANTQSVGAKFLTIGISELVNTHPLNYPRTIAYISKLSEIYNLVKKTKEMPKGWKQLLDEYTTPKPTWTKKEKKCDPNKLDSWDCIKESFSNTFGPGAWKDFNKWKGWHKIDLKCDWMSPDKRQFLLPIGNSPTILDAYKSGGFDDYELPWAPFATEEERAKIVTTVDSQEWLKAWKIHGGPDFEFTGDPSQNEINKIVKEIISPGVGSNSAESLALAAPVMGQEVLSRLYREALAKLDIKEKIKLLINCACNELEEKAIWLENNGIGGDTASLVEADALRAAAAFMGCEDICKVIPLLCACLPFEWPPRFTIPDKFPVVDILAYLMTFLLNAIIDLLIKFVVQLLTVLLDFSFKCETKGPEQAAFSRNFDKSYREIDAPDLNEKLRQNNLPEDSIDPAILNQLLKDTATILKPREFCSLISSNATLQTMEIVERLIIESYPEVRAQFSTTSRVRSLYTMLGEMVDTGICDRLADLMTAVDIDPSNYICERTDLRENMLLGRATDEQIRSMLIEAAKCDTSRLEGIIELAKKSAGGEDFMASVIPAILQDPANPDGLIPREPPSVKFLNEIAKDTVFTPIERQYNSDYNYHPDTIAPLVYESKGIPDNDPRPHAFFPGNVEAKRTSARVIVAPTGDENVAFGQWLDPDNDAHSIIFHYDDDVPNKIVLHLPNQQVWDGGGFYDDPAVATAGIGVGMFKIPTPEDPNGGMQRVGVIPSGSAETKIQKSISYEICPAVRAGIQWDRILDAYKVEATRDGEVYFNFNGEKVLTPGALLVLQDENFGHPIRGIAPPSAEALSSFFLGKWMLLPISDAGPVREDLEAHEVFMRYHMDFLHPSLIKFTLTKIFDSIRKSKFLASNATTAKEKIIAADFSRDFWCTKSDDNIGLLDVDSLRGHATNYASRSTLLDPARNTAAITYGLALTYMKVFLVEMLLDAIFVFSEFSLADLARSDVLMRYFLNRFKERSGLTGSKVLTFGGGFVEEIPFFEDIALRIEKDLRSRKYEDGEEFTNPFTGQPVEVLLAGEKLSQLNLPPDFHLSLEYFQNFINGQMLPERTEEEGGAKESVPLCGVGVTDDNEECFEVGNTTFYNLMSIGSQDPVSGKTSIGFMEYMVKDLLKDMSGEYETTLQPTLLTEGEWLGELAPEVDVPVSAPVGDPRFFVGLNSGGGDDSVFVLNGETLKSIDEELADVWWAWGIIRQEGENIHRFVMDNPDGQGEKFKEILSGVSDNNGVLYNEFLKEWTVTWDCNFSPPRGMGQHTRGSTVLLWLRNQDIYGQAGYRWLREAKSEGGLIVSESLNDLAYRGEKYSTYEARPAAAGDLVAMNFLLERGDDDWDLHQAYQREGYVGRCCFVGPDDPNPDGRQVVVDNAEEPRELGCHDRPDDEGCHNPSGCREASFNFWIREKRYPSATRIETYILNEVSGLSEDILDEASAVDPDEQFPLSNDFKDPGTYDDRGGFILEKFIKVTDKTDAQWGVILTRLSATNPAAADKAERLIKNRDSNLFGVVNLKAWSDWVVSLIEFHEELDLFNTADPDKPYFNIQLYFDRWEAGTRLTYVYPLVDQGDDRSALDRDLIKVFTEYDSRSNPPIEEGQVLPIPMEPDVEDFIRKNKSHLLREDLSFTNQVGLEDPLDPEEVVMLEFEGVEKVVDVKTLPLIWATTELEGADIKFPALLNDTRGALEACIRRIDEIFLDPIAEGSYRSDAIRFNNYVLPYVDATSPQEKHPCRQGNQDKFYYSAFAAPFLWDDYRFGTDGDIDLNWAGFNPHFADTTEGLQDITDFTLNIARDAARQETPKWFINDEVDGHRWALGPDGQVYNETQMPGNPPNFTGTDHQNEYGHGTNAYWRMVNKIWNLGYRLFGFNIWGAFSPPGYFSYLWNGAPTSWTDPLQSPNPDNPDDILELLVADVEESNPSRRDNPQLARPSEYYTDDELNVFPSHPGQISTWVHWPGLQVGGHLRCKARRVQSLEEGNFRTTGNYELCSTAPLSPSAFRDTDHYSLSDFSVKHPFIQCGNQDVDTLVGLAWRQEGVHTEVPYFILQDSDVVEKRLYGPNVLENSFDWVRGELQDGHEEVWYENFVHELLEPHRRLGGEVLPTVSSIDFKWGQHWIYNWLVYKFKRPFEELLDGGDFNEKLSDLSIEHPIYEAMDKLKGFLKNQLNAIESDGVTATTRCWAFDDRPFDEFNNARKGTDNCKNYDRLIYAIQQIEYFIGKILGELVIPTAGIQFETTHQEKSFMLRKQITQNPQYEALLEYMIPTSRLISLATIYNVEHVSGLPNRDIMFKETKDLIRELYNVARGNEHPEWWNRKAKERNRWWQQPAQLPIPLGLLMVPWKILQALFSIIPWLKKLLDISIPGLPPHRNKNRRGCP